MLKLKYDFHENTLLSGQFNKIMKTRIFTVSLPQRIEKKIPFDRECRHVYVDSVHVRNQTKASLQLLTQLFTCLGHFYEIWHLIDVRYKKVYFIDLNVTYLDIIN